MMGRHPEVRKSSAVS